MHLSKFLLSVLIIFLAQFSWSVTNEITEINGFEVHLIDTKGGNKVSVSWGVPVGHRTDPSKVAGRAHALEHMVLKGSLRLPGYHSLPTAFEAIGGSKNAGTGVGATVYYGTVNEANVERAIELLFGPLAGPEFKEEVWLNEREIIINEVVTEGTRDAFRALYLGTAGDLVPSEHPWSRYDLGTAEVLRNMTTADLKELFYGNYTTEHVRIVVAGNFSGGGLDKASVKDSLREHAIAPSVERDPHGFKLREKPVLETPLPSFFELGQIDRFVEYGTSEEMRTSFQIFEASKKLSPKESLALELLRTYLGLSVSGGIVDSLKTRGWISQAGSMTEVVGERTYAVFSPDFTKEGWEHRHEVTSEFLKTVADVRQNGMPAEHLNIIKMLVIDKLEQAYRNVGNIDFMHAKNIMIGDSDLSSLRFREAYGKITMQEIQDVARIVYDPTRSITSYMAPEVTGEIHPLWNRPYRFVNAGDIIGRWEAVSSAKTILGAARPNFPQIPEFRQRASAANPAGSQEWKELKGAEYFMTIWNKGGGSSLEGAFVSEVPIASKDIDERVMLDLYLDAFRERMTDYLTVLKSRGISLSLGTLNSDGAAVQWSGRGPAESLTQAFSHMAKEFLSFTPTYEELSRAREKWRFNLEASISSDFIGSIAVSTALDEIGLKDRSEATLEALDRVEFEKVSKSVQGMRMNARPILFLSGDFSKADLTPLQGAVWNTGRFAFPHSQAPYPISNLTVDAYRKRVYPAPAGKNIESIGLARVYQGPSRLNYLDNFSSTVLGTFIGQAVMDLNRSERGLGYVHSGAVTSVGADRFIFFYGQVEGQSNAELAMRGWEEVIDQVLEGKVPEERWLEIAEAVRTMLRRQAATPVGEIKDALVNFKGSGDPGFTRELLKASEAFTPQDVMRVTETYLGPDRRRVYEQTEIRSPQPKVEVKSFSGPLLCTKFI